MFINGAWFFLSAWQYFDFLNENSSLASTKRKIVWQFDVSTAIKTVKML